MFHLGVFSWDALYTKVQILMQHVFNKKYIVHFGDILPSFCFERKFRNESNHKMKLLGLTPTPSLRIILLCSLTLIATIFNM